MRTEISHFWFGRFESEDEYFNFVGENEEYYLDDEDDEDDEKYISEFAKSQGKQFLDHDFMESGFRDKEILFEEKFRIYSYSSQWIKMAEQRLEDLNCDLSEINTVVFITKELIKNPVSVSTQNFNLLYIGEIEYEI